MEENIVYSSNNGDIGSRTTKDLVTKIFEELAKNLSSESFRVFVSKSRVPNERELYGLFVKSIIDSCGNNLGHIATEFQVARVEVSNGENSGNKGSKGRVDLFFNYRSVIYLVEIKVGLVNAKAKSATISSTSPSLVKLKVGVVNAIGDEGGDEKPKISAWHKAVDQLDNLNIEASRILIKGKRKIVKLPVVLYLFNSRSKLDNAKIEHKAIHENIIKRDDSKYNPDFELYSSIPRTPTRFRSTELDAGENTYLYGFSLFAKQK